MLSQPYTLLRLHVEAVWYVRLSAAFGSEVELLPQASLPDWKLCAAELDEGRVHIWRPDVTPVEREALRPQAEEALTFSLAPRLGVDREFAFTQAAPPRIDSAAARLVARPLNPLTDADSHLLHIFKRIYFIVSLPFLLPEHDHLVQLLTCPRVYDTLCAVTAILSRKMTVG